MFKKILIANRGEIACRVIQTAQKMGILTVAVYSEADQDALHVELADEAVLHRRRAPAARVVPAGRHASSRPASRPAREAVHPGYGFLSENEAFARARRGRGHRLHRPEALFDRGDGRQDRLEEARRTRPRSTPFRATTTPSRRPSTPSRSRKEIGYPVMIKASAGGGGKGLRVACNDTEAFEGFTSCRNEARNSFGDDRVFIEKFVEEPRHIEIQVLGDAHGNVVYLSERECSIQRRHQKVIEEAPSPFIERRHAQGDGRAGGAAGQGREVPERRHGGVRGRQGPELLLPGDEHAPAGRASGDGDDHRPRPGRADDPRRGRREAAVRRRREVQRDGWAIECRINAEDPFRNFLPSTGRLVQFQPPAETMFASDTGHLTACASTPASTTAARSRCTTTR